MSQIESFSCVICQNNISTYAFTLGKNKFSQCNNCNTIAAKNYSLKNNEEIAPLSFKETPRDVKALEKLLFRTIEYRSAKTPYLIISSMNEARLADRLRKKLPDSTIFTSPEALIQLNQKNFCTIILLTPLSRIVELPLFLQTLSTLLVPKGVLIFLQPMVDSSQAKFMKKTWLEWMIPHSFYPTRDALHMMMLRYGFEKLWFQKARYRYTLDYLFERFKNSPSKTIYHHIIKLSRLLPSFLRKLKFRLPSSHIITSCELRAANPEPTLSIILPVFNEKNTFEALIQTLLAKTIEGLRKEIIIVESNSTDGTRELVKKYHDHPDIQIIWQSEPKGKGYAVREGLLAATGDYILIQDADLEYDINDYESLLAPLQKNQVMFVLGSRHTGNWRIREFNDAMTTATVFNIGHVFFTWFVNLLTWQKMTDPFTMFKVFRRDALFGLLFTCKRFDFDHEMVIKLIRKGYQPLELPINYKARSFAEGKKVSFIKDGLTWIYTDLKLRFGKLGQWPT